MSSAHVLDRVSFAAAARTRGTVHPSARSSSESGRRLLAATCPLRPTPVNWPVSPLLLQVPEAYSLYQHCIRTVPRP
jgi:hypothetical protein